MTADARRRAEEYLRFWGHNESDGMEIMRALLARIVELESLLRECNAVCLCGCPDAEHEADECGESCGNDDHECIRVPRAVLAYVERLRSAALPPSDAVREAAERLLAKLDEVHDSPQYRGVFGLAAAHGHVYDGPDYRIEMIGLRNAISEERPRRAGR